MAVYKRYKGERLRKEKGKRLSAEEKEAWQKGKWWMEFQLRGHDIHKSIPGARTQAQAERAENAIRESIYDGKYNKLTKTSRFSDFVDNIYLPLTKKKASWRNDESRAKRLKQFFGVIQIRDITPVLIRRLKNELLSEKTNRIDPKSESEGKKERTLRKGTTVNRHLQLLSKILETAFGEGLIDSNPMRRVELEPEGQGRERYLTYEEERLLAVLNGRLTHLCAPVITAIDTGMRKISELLSLLIEHCNFGHKAIFININGRDVELRPNHLLVVKSKNGDPRTIPMTPRVRTELLGVIQGRTEGPVFSNARTGVNLKEIKKGFKKACQLAGIPYGLNTPGGLVFHDLRHTFSTRLGDRGVIENTRMVLLGQRTLKMTRRYTHATPEMLEEAVSKLGRRTGEVLKFKRMKN
ncbi:MAG TPA: tyrosine-type recombinase/integrase [Pyrinomonadaceae bacterium]|jgi:integrase